MPIRERPGEPGTRFVPKPCAPVSGKDSVQYATLDGHTYVIQSSVRPGSIPPFLGDLSKATINCVYYNPSDANAAFMFGPMRDIITAIITAGAVLTTGGIAGVLPGLGAVVGNAGSTVGGIISSGVTGATSILGSILAAVDNVGKLVTSIIKPVSDTLNGITTTIKDINDKLITPIITPITEIVHDYQSLSQALQADVKEGLRGLVNIPGQLANTLGSINTSFNAALKAIGANQQDFVQSAFLPSMQNNLGKPLGTLHEDLNTQIGNEKAGALFERTDFIYQSNSGKLIDETVDKLLADINNIGGFWGPLIKFMTNLVYITEYVPIRLIQSVKPYEQYVQSSAPYTLLDPSTVIEAWRRGLLTQAEAETELLYHGINTSRQQVLYDVAQFLFGPQDAVNLKARGIIDDQQFTKIMEQNNLDTGQSSALTYLMQFVFSPGEAVDMYYRGIIDDNTYGTYMTANRVGKEAQDLIKLLAMKPASGRVAIAADGKLKAKSDNFLSSSLGKEVPPDYTELYRQNEQPPLQAELDWLLHWRVPPPDWWVEAYFRGLRTKEECYEAFKANNLPVELFDDVIAVDEELPPVWLVPDILGSGVWPRDKAVAAFRKLGFSEENAGVLADYGLSKQNAAAKAAADTLHGLSLANAKALYDNKAIDKDQYLAILTDHGVGEEAAQLTVEIDDIQQNIKDQNDYITYVIDTVKAGQVTKENAVAQLYSDGFSSAQVLAAELKMKQAAALNAKIPTEAVVTDMLLQGIIDVGTWVSAMTTYGYNQAWIERIYELKTGTKIGAPQGG